MNSGPKVPWTKSRPGSENVKKSGSFKNLQTGSDRDQHFSEFLRWTGPDKDQKMAVFVSVKTGCVNFDLICVTFCDM